MTAAAKSIPDSYNPGAERYIITCCLKDPEAILEVANRLTPSDFFVELHRYTFQICLSLVEQDLIPEPVTVYNRLVAAGISKPEHLKQLELIRAASHDIKNLKDYVAVVKSASIKRQLKEGLVGILENTATDDSTTGKDVMELCEAQILSIATAEASEQQVYTMGSETSEVLTERMSDPSEVVGLPTGLSKLDFDTGGLQPGRLYVFSARPKVGKSILLLNIVKHVAVDLGVPVLMVDTEMNHRLVEDRLISLLSGVEEKKVENGLFGANEKDYKKILEAGEKLMNAKIYHHYMPHFTTEGLISLAKKYKLQKDIGLVVFDYIKTPDDTDFRSVQEYQMLGYMTSALKNKIAGTLDIPVVTACQLGRSAIGEEKGSDAHVADSDRIGRYADCLVYMRPLTDREIETYGEGPAFGNRVLSIQLNRGGPAQEGLYCVYFDKPVMKMTEVGTRPF